MRQEKNLPPSLTDENFITLIFCPVLNIKDMATFTALAKNFHYSTKVLGSLARLN